MFDIFESEHSYKLSHINSYYKDINLDDDISAHASGHYNKKSHGTKVTGFKQAKDLKKILVSGARGKAKNKD